MKNRRGFTLVDLLVALAILALVMTAVYSVFAFQERAMTVATRNREVYGQGLMILDRLSRDLTGAWLPLTGLKSARIVYGFEATKDQLNFVTTASLTPDPNPAPDVVEVGYRLESDPDRPREDERKNLIRRQDDTPDEDPNAGGAEIILSRNVISLEIVFLGESGAAEPTWSAQTMNQLPKTARITLVLATDVEGENESFITMVSLPLTQPTIHSIATPSGWVLPF